MSAEAELHAAICNAVILLNNGEEIAPEVSAILRTALAKYNPAPPVVDACELQQCPNCLNDGCHCATCNPYPGELQQAQVVGEFRIAPKVPTPDMLVEMNKGLDYGWAHAYERLWSSLPQSSAPVVGESVQAYRAKLVAAMNLADQDGRHLNAQGCQQAIAALDFTVAALTTPQSSAPVVGDEMVAKAYRVCEDFIEEHGDGYLNELDDGQWNEMLHAALTAALGKGEG